MKNKDLRNERGQVLVELAVTSIFFVLLSLGVFDMARMLLATHQLTQAAREGARLASTAQRLNTGNVKNQIEGRIQGLLVAGGVNPGDIRINILTVDTNADNVADTVDVSLSYINPPFVSIIPAMNSFRPSSTISMPMFGSA